MMKHVFSVAAALAFLALAPITPALADDPGVVTFSGTISETNREPITSEDHGLFSHHDIAFDKGYLFDRATLSAMPQTSYEDDFPRSEGTYRGPYLADLLAHVGATGNRLVLTGLDGYAVEIDRSDIEEHKPIVAIEINGRPMAIGEFGPTKLVFPKVGDAEMDKRLRSKGVYALFHVSVERD